MNLRSVRFLLGLPAVVLAWATATILAITPVERHFGREVEREPAIEALRQRGARTAVSGRDVTVVSDFEPQQERRRAAELASSLIPGLRRFSLEVATPVAMTPFRFAVRRDIARMTFSGGVPAGALHARLSDEAAALAGTGNVRDELRPALDAPDGFEEAAVIAVGVAGALASGEVDVTDRLVSVYGEAPDFAGYNRVVAALRKLPAGFTLGPVDVTPPEARAYMWSASRSAEAIRLSGYVSSEQARAALRKAAETELPGLAFVDEMQTARGLDAGVDFAAVSTRAFSALAQLEEGRVELAGRRLSVTGGGPALDLLAVLRAEIGRDPPRGVEIAAIDLRPIKLVPYRFGIVRERGGIVLTGYVPDEPQRATLLGWVRQAALDQPVRDGLHSADGAPDGFAAASRVAVESVLDLAEGRAFITANRLSLSGRALYPGVVARIRERVPRALPPGWTGAADVTATAFAKPLDPTQCGDLLSDIVAHEPVRFDAARAEPTSRSRGTVEAAASVLRRCGAAQVRITAETEAGRDAAAAQGLAQRRAETVAAMLVGFAGEGVRITADGRSVTSKAAGDGSPAGARPSEDRLTIEVQP